MRALIEICLESAESVLLAEKGGADRVELCSDLFEGGLTPSLGCFRTARKMTDKIRINVMIRPRGGDFCYSDSEFETMKEDARLFREAGADGIVFGILTPDGRIDVERSKELIDIARPLPVTFHRAFDMSRDGFESLETLIDLSVDRVLTSGLEESVTEGADMIESLIKRAGDRIIVMPGCGFTERNFEKLSARFRAKEYHIFLPEDIQTRMVYRPSHIYMGGMLRQNEFAIQQTATSRVKNIMGMV